MREFRATVKSGNDRQEFALQLEDSCPLDPQFLLTYFEEGTAKGEVFKPGETLQVGWMLTQIREGEEEGVLELWEPDFQSFPIVWQRGINLTLRDFYLQKWICDEVGMTWNPPSLRQAAFLSPCFQSAQNVSLFQTGHLDGCAWIGMSMGYEGSEGKHESLYQASLWHPKIIPFLGLSVAETQIEIFPDLIEIYCQGERVSSSDTSELLKGIASK